jgi:hypothetical protein
LFEEVRARNRDLTALSEVGRAVSSTLDLRIVLKTIVERAVALSEIDGGSIFYYRQETDRFELGETTGLAEEVVAEFRQLDISDRSNTRAKGGTGLGLAARRAHLGGVDAGSGLSVPHGAARARRSPRGRNMNKRILIVRKRRICAPSGAISSQPPAMRDRGS